MEHEEIQKKKALLFTTISRLIPTTEVLRKKTLEKLIELTLFSIYPRAGDAKKIGSLINKECGFVLPPTIVQEILDGLAEGERVKKDSEKYYLFKEVFEEIEAGQTGAEKRYQSVIKRIFKVRDSGDLEKYYLPFLEYISLVFSKLADEYVKILKGEISQSDFVSSGFIIDSIKVILKSYSSVDKEIFSNGIYVFLKTTPDPDFDLIKWYTSQNYYLAKSIGLDPAGYILSEEIFKNGSFYLDTNVLVAAIEGKHRHHDSITILMKKAKQLNIDIYVSEATKSELLHTVNDQKKLLEKVIDNIPLELHHRMRSDFLEKYDELKNHNPDAKIDEVFKDYEDLNNTFEKLNIKVVDDEWFDREKDSPSTGMLADYLKTKYKKMRSKEKESLPAFHDALMLRWIHEIEQKDRRTWFITLDTTLPGPLGEIKTEYSIAITLDAILQYFAPMAGETDDFQKIFSNLVKNRLLPEERMFDLKDFLIFDQLGIQTKTLPIDDVEGCLIDLKGKFSNTDLSNPVIKRNMDYEVARYFTDPSRKFNLEVMRLEGELKNTKNMTAEEIDRLKTELSEKLLEKDKIHQSIASELNIKISQLTTTGETEKLKHEGQLRGLVLAMLLVAMEFGMFKLSQVYGDGDNWFQKMLASWEGFGITGVLWIFICYFLIGKKRFVAMGWPFTEIFKIKDLSE